MGKTRSKYTPGDYTLRVRRSRTGKGLFTLQDIPKGVCIIEYTGKPITEEMADEKRGKYLFEVAKGKTIDGNIPSNIARYINHSCAPNCEATGPKGRVFIFSLRRIKAGSEIFYDYGKEYFDEHLKAKGCLCSKCAKKAENSF